jgi:hypothetical protein
LSGLDREPGLPDPRRPDHGHQTVRGQRGDDIGHVVGPPDDRRGRRGEVARLRQRAPPWRQQQRTLLQHLVLQLLQGRAGLDAELGDQQMTQRRVRGQRAGLPVRAVEGGDQRRPEGFAQRVLLDERLELDDQVGTRPQREARRHGVLQEAQPHLLQPGAVRTSPVAGVDEHLPPEESQTFAGQLERSRRVSCRPSSRARGGQADHPDRVHGVRGNGQGVTARRRPQQTGISERPA